jgi:hypothetical protein
LCRNRWPTAFASLVVGTGFFALWFWLLPRWLGFSVETAGHGAITDGNLEWQDETNLRVLRLQSGEPPRVPRCH